MNQELNSHILQNQTAKLMLIQLLVSHTFDFNTSVMHVRVVSIDIAGKVYWVVEVIKLNILINVRWAAGG